MKPDWVFFDLDGTLADSLPALYSVYAEYLHSHGLQPSRDEFETLNGPSILQIADILASRYPALGTPANIHKDYLQALQQVYPDCIALRAGATLLTAALQARGYTLALVTSAPATIANKFMETHFSQSTFSFVVTGEEVQASKPDPAIYQVAMQRAGVDPDRILVVEDSTNGIESAKAAGLNCIQVSSTGSIVDEVLEALHEDSHNIASADVVCEGRFQITSLPSHPPSFDAACTAQIEEVWQQEKQQRGDALFNGSGFSIARLSQQDGRWHVQGHFATYKHLLAQRRRPSLNLGYRPLGVSGIATIQDNGITYVLFARRAKNVTQYPGYLELVPSGTLDPSSMDEHGEVDGVAQLQQEWIEETGLPANTIQSCESFCMIVDHRDLIYDLCFHIHVQASVEDVLQTMKTSSEYEHPECVALDALPSFLQDHKQHIVPTSLTMLHHALDHELLLLS